MRPGLLIAWLTAAIIVGMPANALACTVTDAQAYVKALGHGKEQTDPDTVLGCFAEHGKEAAGMLVQELHPVPVAKISDEGKYPSAMHVIWALRSLYAITGLNPVGGSREAVFDDKKLSENRRYWITFMSSGGVHMFGVPDSSGTIYLAPQDAQAAVIAKWKAWHAKDGASYHYAYDPDKRWWYGGYGEPGNEPGP